MSNGDLGLKVPSVPLQVHPIVVVVMAAVAVLAQVAAMAVLTAVRLLVLELALMDAKPCAMVLAKTPVVGHVNMCRQEVLAQVVQGLVLPIVITSAH